MKKLLLTLTLLSSWFLLGCQSESDSMAPAPIKPGEEKIRGEGVKIEINPRVDILFVIDDSGSMKAHQANLSKNISNFVDGFGKNNLIDFHIGVISIWDSRRYGEYDAELNQVLRPGVVPAIGRDNKALFDPIGQLRPLKAPEGKEASLAKQAKNYVTKGDDFIDILRETLKIGVREYHKITDDKFDAQGPEYEEVFSPVMAALRDPLSSGWNKGFNRGMDSHLVVVFVTDANDASNISADQMFRFLQNLKGANNFTVFGVINPSQQRLNCARDPSGPPYKIESLIEKTGGRSLNMCADYATQLVEIGKMIQDRTLREIRYRPKTKPVVDSIQISYGNQPIPFDQWAGWTYDGATKSIIIRGAAQWPAQPGAKIAIDFESVDPTRPSSHCIGCAPAGNK